MEKEDKKTATKAPENQWLEDELYFWHALIFRGELSVSGGGDLVFRIF